MEALEKMATLATHAETMDEDLDEEESLDICPVSDDFWAQVKQEFERQEFADGRHDRTGRWSHARLAL